MVSKNTYHQPRITDQDRMYFKEIFNLEAKVMDGKDSQMRIDLDALERIFKMVGFEPNAKQSEEFGQMFKQSHHPGTLNFVEFMQVFSLKSNPEFQEVDVKNAFRLLSKNYESERPNQIKIDRVKEILTEMGITDLEIVQLTTQLQGLCDTDGYFNFENFVRDAF